MGKDSQDLGTFMLQLMNQAKKSGQPVFAQSNLGNFVILTEDLHNAMLSLIYKIQNEENNSGGLH